MSDNYNKDLAKNIKSILTEIGEYPARKGLIQTPKRVAKSIEFLTNGYKENPSKILKSPAQYPFTISVWVYMGWILDLKEHLSNC